MARRAAMPLECLLFTRNEAMVALLQKVFDDSGMQAKVTADPQEAAEQARSRKLDCIVIDWNEAADAASLLDAVRASAYNAKSFVMALVNDCAELKTALALQASMVSYKPASLEQAMRAFRSAYAFILRQRRLCMRHNVHITVALRAMGSLPVQAVMRNLSEGGALLHCNRPLVKNESLSFAFALPGESGGVIHAGARVVWSDAGGKTGVRFTVIAAADSACFTNWLDRQTLYHTTQTATELILKQPA